MAKRKVSIKQIDAIAYLGKGLDAISIADIGAADGPGMNRLDLQLHRSFPAGNEPFVTPGN